MAFEDLPKKRQEHLFRCIAKREERLAQEALFRYQSGIVVAASKGEEALIEQPVSFNFFEKGRGTSFKPEG